MTQKDYKKYLDYLRNAGPRVKTIHFDEDWEPIGKIIRAEMKAHGLTDESGGYMIALLHPVEAP
jgi:hypothetical protein